MRTLPLLVRLAWKEWRLSWPLLALGVLLPPLAVSLDEEHVRFLSAHPTTVILFLLLLAVIAWCSLQLSGGRTRHSYAEIHFPLHPGWPAVVTFFNQGIIVACIGAVVGLSFTPQIPLPLQIGQSIALFLSVTLLAGAVARAISPPAGMAAGTLWLLFGAKELFDRVTGIMGVDQGLFKDYDDGRRSCAWLTLATNHQYELLCLLAAFVAFLLLIGVKGGSRTRRVCAVALLVLATIGYPIANANPVAWFGTARYQYDAAQLSLTSADGALLLTPDLTGTKSWETPPRVFYLQDRRTGQCVQQQFPLPMKPLLVDAHRAVLLGQGPGKRQLTVYRWEMAGNRLQTVGSLPAKRDTWIQLAFQGNGYSSITISCSPDDRYALLNLPSLTHEDYVNDLWFIDFVRSRVRLLLPCAYSSSMVISWQPDRAIISGSPEPRCIALPSGAITPWHFPSPKEGTR